MYKLNENAWFEDDLTNMVVKTKTMLNVFCPICNKRFVVRFADRFGKRGNKTTICAACNRAVKMNKEIDKRYGRLVVLALVAEMKGKRRKYYASCICDCGNFHTTELANLRYGETRSCGCLLIESRHNLCGEKHPNFNNKLTDEEREVMKRRNNDAKKWKAKVRQGFGNTCFLCGSSENLEAHHLQSFKVNKEVRFQYQNGICLCHSCHIKYHSNFLGGFRVPATKESFVAFMEYEICQRLQI